MFMYYKAYTLCMHCVLSVCTITPLSSMLQEALYKFYVCKNTCIDLYATHVTPAPTDPLITSAQRNVIAQCFA